MAQVALPDAVVFLEMRLLCFLIGTFKIGGSEVWALKLDRRPHFRNMASRGKWWGCSGKNDQPFL